MSPELRFLIALTKRLRPLKDPVDIREVTVLLIGEHLGASSVNYTHSKAIVDACRRGETVAVEDVSTDSRLTAAEREQLLADGTAAFVSAPVVKAGRWLGSLDVHSATPRTWTRGQITLVEVTAERTWGTGERVRAEEALGRSESRQAFLRSLTDTVRELVDPAQIVRETCRRLGTHLRVNRVAFCEIEGDDCIVVHDYVDGVPSLAGCLQWRNLAGSRTADILKGWTLSVDDTSTGPHSTEERAALEAADIKAYITPLLIKDGRLTGSFGVHSRVPRVWTPEEIALVQDVADRTWATLEHRKAEAELRANEERLAFLLRLNDEIRGLSDPMAIQKTAAREIGEYLGAARVAYAEPEGGEYVIRCEHARGVESLVGRPLRVTMRSMLREPLLRGETVVVSDVHTDERLSADHRATFRSLRIASFVGAGLFKSGQMVAVFGVNHDTPRAWTSREIEFVRDVAQRTWDAVEHARAEAALLEQKARLSVALEATAGGSWTWDLRTNKVDWDQTFRTRFGFSLEEQPSFETWLESVHVDDRSRTLDKLESILLTGDRWDHVYRVLRPDGALVWIQSLGRADRGSDGRVIRLTGLELDITERRRIEDALQARREEEYDRTLRTLLETATQGIASADARGILVFTNRAIEAMFGWPAGELVGQPIECLIPGLFRIGASPAGSMDLAGIRQDGSTFPVEVTVNHVPTPGGGRYFVFVSDITERRRAAAALEERTNELEYRTTQLSRMARDLTLAEHQAREQIARTLHDGLQQLLVIVALNLDQQLKQENQAGIAPHELLAEAREQIHEAIAVVRSLNVELFPPVLQRSGLPAALTWLAKWTEDKYKLSVDITADPQADSPWKDVRTLLFESVRELLFNAVKYAKADRVTLRLELDANDQLCISVADRGVGFEPARLHDRSNTGQVGWGLFRIRERVTLLGGRLDIESAPGRGTRICLVVPRQSVQGNGAAANESSLAVAGAASAADDGRALPDAVRILIVDDHEPVRRVLREMLHQRPELAVVGDAANGLQAIAHAYTLRPDVILMDVSMPHMDGVEATERIHAELPDIRILGMSTLPRSEIAEAIEHAGAAGFFVKGIDTQRLFEHLLALHASRGAGKT